MPHHVPLVGTTTCYTKEEFSCVVVEEDEDEVGAPAIRTEGLTKRYGDVAALDHLDLEVAPG